MTSSSWPPQQLFAFHHPGTKIHHQQGNSFLCIKTLSFLHLRVEVILFLDIAQLLPSFSDFSIESQHPRDIPRIRPSTKRASPLPSSQSVKMAPTEDPDHTQHKKKVNLHDASGAEHKDVRLNDSRPMTV